mmetsp:Transcript_7503/g.17627  ORF Transcript_7503/g.17627 Transcript_7503/m.17627 type:complete len:423 (+) Transcript_7503:6110-7378(+)
MEPRSRIGAASAAAATQPWTSAAETERSLRMRCATRRARTPTGTGPALGVMALRTLPRRGRTMAPSMASVARGSTCAVCAVATEARALAAGESRELWRTSVACVRETDPPVWDATVKRPRKGSRSSATAVSSVWGRRHLVSSEPVRLMPQLGKWSPSATTRRSSRRNSASKTVLGSSRGPSLIGAEGAVDRTSTTATHLIWTTPTGQNRLGVRSVCTRMSAACVAEMGRRAGGAATKRVRLECPSLDLSPIFAVCVKETTRAALAVTTSSIPARSRTTVACATAAIATRTSAACASGTTRCAPDAMESRIVGRLSMLARSAAATTTASGEMETRLLSRRARSKRLCLNGSWLRTPAAPDAIPPPPCGGRCSWRSSSLRRRSPRSRRTTGFTRSQFVHTRSRILKITGGSSPRCSRRVGIPLA